MKNTINLWPEEIVEADGLITVSVAIEGLERDRTRLWYRFPAQYRHLTTSSCDPFVVAMILIAMSNSQNLRVRGELSPSLLQNLAEFQAAWASWRPEVYREIEISAEVERERERAKPQEGKTQQERAIAAFSGGVDSCFTLFRHRTGRSARSRRNIEAALMVLGFDIDLENEEMFERAAAKSRQMVGSLGVEFIPMTSNYRQLKPDWEDTHGCAIASCMMLLQGGYTAGLIGSFLPYQALQLPWGTNPISDRLLSSNSFEIVHDGAAFTRLEKIRQIAAWPEALQDLRVCWQGERQDRNCGRCEKCIRTILAFRSLGLGLPPCFERDATDAQLRELKKVKPAQLAELELILATAKAKNISDSWTSALETGIKRNRRSWVMAGYKETLKKQLPSPVLRGIRLGRSLFSK